MKGFKEFIGESQEDWENWPLALPDRQYQYIEDHLGKTPVFISSIKQSSTFDMLDEIVDANPIHKDYLIDTTYGVRSRVTRFEPVDGLTIILIRPLRSKEFQLYFALRAEDFQKLREGGLDQWKIDNLFGDF